MRKKGIGVVLFTSICVLTGCFSTIPDTDVQYKIIDGEAIIEGYTDKTTVNEIIIPAEVDEIPITGIADFAIANAENLHRIVIGKNVKNIDNWAISNNWNLQSIEVAEGEGNDNLIPDFNAYTDPLSPMTGFEEMAYRHGDDSKIGMDSPSDLGEIVDIIKTIATDPESLDTSSNPESLTTDSTDNTIEEQDK